MTSHTPTPLLPPPAAYYKPAKDVGVGFDVFSNRDRLIAWVGAEPIAKDMVDRLNNKPGRDELSEREGPSCKG